ncbi:MAG: hypothetical protein B6I28_01980 [Fusobacteriia bacterium 4572_132]|nr:MAG: hypothetical protein B6I28_01980 [Fusobacteriia bacterium 4572_132]
MANKILLIIIMTFFFGFELIGSEILVENKIEIGDELTISAPNIEEDIKWELIEKPLFSRVYLEKKLKKVNMVPEVAGIYKLKLYSEKIIENKKIYVFRTTRKKEDEIEIEIEKNYKEKDLDDLQKNVEILQKNYPNSKKIMESFYKISLLSKELKKYKEENETLFFLYDEYKMSPKTKEKILKRLIELDKVLENENNEFIKKILRKNENNEFYLAKSNIVSGNVTEKQLQKLKKEYSKELNTELGKLLGDYYNKIGDNIRAEEFYKKSNKLDLAKLYLKDKKVEEVEQLMSELSEKSKNELEIMKKNILNLKEEKEYYKKAEESLKNNKFNIAKLYYSKILKRSTNKDLLKNTYYKMSKLYSLINEYQKSKEYIEEYIKKYANIKDVKAYYDLALIDYNLGNYKQAKKGFEKILELYPYTVWETKAKIYMLKMKRLRGDLG